MPENINRIKTENDAPIPKKATVMVPIKDLNSMTIGYEEKIVDFSSLEKKTVPGGLAAPRAY